jgi:hypothetical protein
VEASNSCVRTLILSSFLLFPFVKFFPAPFRIFDFTFYCFFCFFNFLSHFVFSLLFCSCFVPIFLAHMVSSLAYLNLLGNKMLCCCCKFRTWPRENVAPKCGCLKWLYTCMLYDLIAWIFLFSLLTR